MRTFSNYKDTYDFNKDSFLIEDSQSVHGICEFSRDDYQLLLDFQERGFQVD